MGGSGLLVKFAQSPGNHGALGADSEICDHMGADSEICDHNYTAPANEQAAQPLFVGSDRAAPGRALVAAVVCGVLGAAGSQAPRRLRTACPGPGGGGGRR
jgi:hypothetical protein